MNEKICKFCLKTMYNDFHTIKESLKGHMDELLLKQNSNILKETVMCNECVKNLQAFFNFKTTYVYMRDKTLPLNGLKKDVCVDLEQIENTDNVESMAESKNQIKCCFCIKSTGRDDLISLNDSEENMFIVEKLEEHISEMNSINTEKHLTCETCLGILHGVLSFIINCLDVEEKVRQYIDIEDKGDIKLNGVQQFTLKPNIKSEVGCCSANEIEERSDKNQGFTIRITTEIKDEVTDNLSLIPKTECVNIKSEINDFNSFQEITVDNAKIYSYQCEVCSFNATSKAVINKHMLTHKIPSVITTYKCEICTYKTQEKDYLDRHMRIHKVCLEVKMYKCKMCPYEAKNSGSVHHHMRIHEDPSETTMYKCELCTYETKYKSALKQHMINHKDPSQITMYKCDSCIFESKRKYSLNQHLLIHKKHSNAMAFKCEMCTYETIYEKIFKHHMLTHKCTSDIIMYKCEMCAYETKRKGNLNRHLRSHKKPTDNVQV